MSEPGRGRGARLGELTSEELGALLAGDQPVAVLVPVGSVEPHGPHLALIADAAISEAACARAVPLLARRGVAARIAPVVGYGVTDCAAAFPGAVSIPAAVLTAYLRAVADGFLATGAAHVCLVNNHLEPAHDRAVRAAAAACAAGRVSVACPLAPRWGRTLSAEFKSGACHAGRYESSILLAAAPALVDDERRRRLPEVAISLSDQLRAGVTDFVAMGLERAYAGAPAEASAEEGEALLARLADMIAAEVCEALVGTGSSP